MGDWRKASEGAGAESGHLEHASKDFGVRPVSSPYMTRAAIRPDRRLKTSHPGGARYASDGRRRKTLLRTPDIAKRVEPSEASTQNLIEVLRKLEGRDELEQSFALFSKSKPSAA